MASIKLKVQVEYQVDHSAAIPIGGTWKVLGKFTCKVYEPDEVFTLGWLVGPIPPLGGYVMDGHTLVQPWVRFLHTPKIKPGINTFKLGSFPFKMADTVLANGSPVPLPVAVGGKFGWPYKAVAFDDGITVGNKLKFDTTDMKTKAVVSESVTVTAVSPLQATFTKAYAKFSKANFIAGFGKQTIVTVLKGGGDNSIDTNLKVHWRARYNPGTGDLLADMNDGGDYTFPFLNWPV